MATGNKKQSESSKIAAQREADIQKDLAIFKSSLLKINKQWQGEIVGLMGKLKSDPNASGRLRELAYLQTQMKSQLTSLGYEKLASKFVANLDKAQQAAFDVLVAGAHNPTAIVFDRVAPINQNALETLQHLHYLRFVKHGDDAVKAVAEGVIRNAIAGEPKEKFIADLQKKLGAFGSRASTHAETALRSYDRQVQAELWDSAGVENFRYDGPNDIKTRPFCVKRVGKTYTKKQIDMMTNGTPLLPVRIYGGGANCRHTWRAAPYPKVVKSKLYARPLYAPEAVAWQTEMNPESAAEWAKNSKFKDKLYFYVEKGPKSASVLTTGFEQTGGAFGEGAYFTADPDSPFKVNLKAKWTQGKVDKYTCQLNVDNPLFLNSAAAFDKWGKTRTEANENIRKAGYDSIVLSIPGKPSTVILFDHKKATVLNGKVAKKEIIPDPPKLDLPKNTSSGNKLNDAIDKSWNELLAHKQPFTFVKNAAALGGAHPKSIYEDPFGNQWLFKPQEEFLAKGDQAWYMVARSAIGAEKTVEVRYVVIDGKVGSIQRMLDLKTPKDLKNWQTSGQLADKLSSDDIKTIQKEHVIDWLISNHDAHGGQFVRTNIGLVGIDKGQAFKYFPKDKLAPDYHPNEKYGETEPIYNTLYKLIGKGKVAFNPMDVLDSIKSVESIPDDKYRAMIKPYFDARFKYDKASADKFLNLAVERKNNLRQDFEKLYSEVLGKPFKFYGVPQQTTKPPLFQLSSVPDPPASAGVTTPKSVVGFKEAIISNTKKLESDLASMSLEMKHKGKLAAGAFSQGDSKLFFSAKESVDALGGVVGDARAKMLKAVVDSVAGSDRQTGKIAFSVKFKDVPYNAEVEARVNAAVQFVEAIVGPGVDKKTTFVVRASMRPNYHKDLNRIRFYPEATFEELVHEIGHMLEESEPELKQKLQAFYQARTKNDSLEKLSSVTGNKAYKPSETTKKDQWFHAYMGKVNEEGETELLASLLEYLAKKPASFLQHEGELFDLAIGHFRDRSTQTLEQARFESGRGKSGIQTKIQFGTAEERAKAKAATLKLKGIIAATTTAERKDNFASAAIAIAKNPIVSKNLGALPVSHFGYTDKLPSSIAQSDANTKAYTALGLLASQWNGDSWQFDNLQRLHLATVDMTGVSESHFGRVNTIKPEIKKSYNEKKEVYGVIAKEVYNKTQERLKASGLKTVRLYRGVKKLKIPEGITDVKLQPLSSFSTSFDRAKGFAGSSGVVIGVDVPVERIYSYFGTGPGTDYEHEAVVIGGLTEAFCQKAYGMSFQDFDAKLEKAASSKGYSEPFSIDDDPEDSNWLKYTSSLPFGSVEEMTSWLEQNSMTQEEFFSTSLFAAHVDSTEWLRNYAKNLGVIS